MQPISTILNRLYRLVRDLAGQLSKEVELVIEGGQVELDKSILEGLADPLVHIVRNCVDHGIESPGERAAAGKVSVGRIRLKAYHEAGQVNITINDDGRGINTGALIERGISSGLLNPEDVKRLTENEKVNLIFLPGSSTARVVTGISGRGVGMDIVKTNIERLGGHIEVINSAGLGASFHIRLPLTLAIIPSLIVSAGNQRFAIPQVNIRELVCIQAEEVRRRIEKVGEAPVLRLKDRLLPLVRLADFLGLNRSFIHPVTGEELIDRRKNLADRRNFLDDEPVNHGADRRNTAGGRRLRRQGDIYVVVVRQGENLFGLVVDELFDIEEIVVKPLNNHLKDCRCFAKLRLRKSTQRSCAGGEKGQGRGEMPPRAGNPISSSTTPWRSILPCRSEALPGSRGLIPA
jgi:two-component system chemotaxis sensor kinase CheA